MKKKTLIFIGLLFLFFAGLTAFLWQGFNQFLAQPLGISEEISIKKGDSAYSLGKQWQADGVIGQFYYYQLMLKMHPELRSIKAGKYQITADMTARDVLHTFVKGKVISHYFTIVEGSNIYEMMASLESETKLTHELSASDAKQKFLLNHLQENNKNTSIQEFMGDSFGKHYAEGVFFADTYQFTDGDSDIDILVRSYQAMRKVLAEEWANKADNLPYKTPYEALIMASIIEKETAVPSERSEIAGVFVRRLEKGMLLQTDPTIIYGLLPEFDGDIRRKDIRNPHPWNTYVHKGLPPSPIAMVGREAIHAALHPKAGKSLYFVAKGDGSHQFSTTLAEHNRAVRKYQLKR